MLIEIVAIGTKLPAWTEAGYEEYAKRLPREWDLQVKELAVARRGKTDSVEKLIQDEGKRMMAVVKPGAIVIALDREGTNWSTEKLADNFGRWMQETSHIQFLIGGPDGLSQECLQRANARWSLSKLTFPHVYVRMLLAEQIYRAWSIINNHPYHK
ncbi:MAG: 23S rRNA (pseudouridine(1915)-N(3))-methyltransferase RlmH [Pseudomonadales bacterium]|nr:23S rRNA (pseudouridine(1915)-N(3))-methyltransferase RlmH [Pseudomonadales bacterium]